MALSNPGLVSDRDNARVTRLTELFRLWTTGSLAVVRAGPSSSVYTPNNEDVVLIARSREHPTN